MTLIQQYVSSLIRGLADQAAAISELEHRLSKGRLREIFIRTVIRRFLTPQFGVGSGIIVNQRGDQSSEQDIVIFDRRILPPFIEEEGLGVFPVEAVLATIEVKSNLCDDDVLAAEENAQRLVNLSQSGTIYESDIGSHPNVAIFGFKPKSLSCAVDTPVAHQWLKSKTRYLWAINVLGKISWLNFRPWISRTGDTEFEETKQFLAVFFDNLRTDAEQRYQRLTSVHRDWLSVYTRWDCSGSAYLRGESTTHSASTTSTSSSTTTSGLGTTAALQPAQLPTSRPPEPLAQDGTNCSNENDSFLCTDWNSVICDDENC